MPLGPDGLLVEHGGARARPPPRPSAARSASTGGVSDPPGSFTRSRASATASATRCPALDRLLQSLPALARRRRPRPAGRPGRSCGSGRSGRSRPRSPRPEPARRPERSAPPAAGRARPPTRRAGAGAAARPRHRPGAARATSTSAAGPRPATTRRPSSPERSRASPGPPVNPAASSAPGPPASGPRRGGPTAPRPRARGIVGGGRGTERDRHAAILQAFCVRTCS